MGVDEADVAEGEAAAANGEVLDVLEAEDDVVEGAFEVGVGGGFFVPDASNIF